jgi:hypothetical protein
MKKTLITTVAAAVLLSGCASSPVNGLFTFTKHSTGGDAGVQLDSTANSSKTGESICTSILNLIAFGDCSVEAAANEAGITKVKSVSHESTNLYLFYSSYSTIVTGE